MRVHCDNTQPIKWLIINVYDLESSPMPINFMGTSSRNELTVAIVNYFWSHQVHSRGVKPAKFLYIKYNHLYLQYEP